MASTNRFRNSTKRGKVAGINTDLYEINTILTAPVAYDELTVSGVERTFQVINPDFEDGGVKVKDIPIS